MFSVWILKGYKLIVLNCNSKCNVEDKRFEQVDDKGVFCSSLSVGNGATSVASGSVAEVTSSLAEISGKGSALPPINANKNPNRALGMRPSSEPPIPNSDNSVALSSSSDPFVESQLPGSVDTITCGGNTLHRDEPTTVNPVENKLVLGQHTTFGFFSSITVGILTYD